MDQIKIALIHYDGCMNTAVYGLQDMFTVANTLAQTKLFSVQIIRYEGNRSLFPSKIKTGFDVVIIPPSINTKFYLDPHPKLNEWLNKAHHSKTLLCSVCSGVFFLAQAGLLNEKTVTTHWGLVSEFKTRYPEIELNTKKILIDEGDIITAGGLMSWTDLGLALVGRFAGKTLLSQIGKYLILDTAGREQQYFHVMDYALKHGDEEVLRVQRHFIKNFSKPLSIKEVAKRFSFGERTLLRRFMKATRRTPHQYIQELRIYKSCEYIEGTNQSIERIANKVGYEDLGAFRKVFTKIVGLKPLQYRQRFMIKMPRG